MLDEEGQRWASWGESEMGHGRDQTITRSIEEQRLQRLLILGSKRDGDLEEMVWVWS